MSGTDSDGIDRRTVLKRSAMVGVPVFGAKVATAQRESNSSRDEKGGNEHTGGKILLDHEPPDPDRFATDAQRFFVEGLSGPVDLPSFVDEDETDRTGPCFPANGRQQYKEGAIFWEIDEIPEVSGQGAVKENQKLAEFLPGGNHYEVVNYRQCSEDNDLYMATYKPDK